MRQGKLDEARALEGARVTAVREGNSLWPGLAAFTGITFVVYLLVKVSSGATPLDAGFATQIGLAGALAGLGGWLMIRARYFYVDVETEGGRRRIKGLTKPEQQEIARRLAPAG